MADTATPIATEDTPSSGMIPMQGDPESTTVTAPPQQPTQPGDSPSIGNIPSITPQDYMNPSVMLPHEGWMLRALHATTSALAGDQTIHITKDKDGNVTMTHDPSKEGEKWGRIAAAALTGAAAGLANSQGPGGLARAGAAGFQAGAQIPQQREQQAQQQVTFDNQQLMAKANRIHITQSNYIQAQQAKIADIQFDQATADKINGYAKSLMAHGTDLGTFDTEHQSLLDFTKNNPTALDAYLGKGNQVLRAVPTPDHKIHAVLTDAAEEDKKNTEPMEAFKFGKGPDGEYGLQSYTVPPLGGKVADIRNGNETALKDASTYATGKKNMADANKPAAQPKTLAEMNLAIANATDPAEIARLTQARDATFRQQKDLRTVNQVNVGTVPPGTTPAQMIAPGGRFAPGTVDGTNARMLATGDVTKMPMRMAKGAPTPYEMRAAAEEYSQQMYGLPYSETMIDQEKKFFDNIKTQGILDGIDKMIGTSGQPGYLDTVVDLARKAGVGANAPWNTIALTVKNKLGETAAKNFSTALGEVQRNLPGLIGNPLLGGSDSDLKQRQAEKMFGSDVTAGNMVGTADTLRGMMHGSAQSMTRNNRFLQRRYGLQGPYAAQQGGGGQQQQGGGGGAAKFAAAPHQPPNPPYAGAVFGSGPNGPGWYPPGS
jgi:hypothetical protein